MKVYVQTDLEGCAGFVFFQDFQDKSPEAFRHYDRMCRLLTNEVNAAVKAAFDSGAAEVIVNDSHGIGYNIIFEELDPRCEIIHGRNCSGPHWLPLLDSSFDALVLVGMHAMEGTEKAITPHSKWEVNDGEIYMSEASMAAAIAGDYGIPAVFVSGDDKLTSEVKEKITNIETAVVKTSLAAYQAKSLIPAKACELIYEGVKAGIANRDKIKPYFIKGPVKLQLLDNKGHIPPLKPIIPEAIGGDTIDEAFMNFERAMPWTKFDVNVPDGFQYPSLEIRKY